MAADPPRRRSRDRWDGPSARVLVTMPADLHREAQRVATRDGVTLAAVVRRALQAEVDRPG